MKLRIDDIVEIKREDEVVFTVQIGNKEFTGTVTMEEDARGGTTFRTFTDFTWNEVPDKVSDEALLRLEETITTGIDEQLDEFIEDSFGAPEPSKDVWSNKEFDVSRS